MMETDVRETKDMKAIGVIPARYGSTRLPGKPLRLIYGKPLLDWVITGVKKSTKISEFFVATDHPEIAQLAETCGVKAIMTEPELPSGSDRVWAASQKIEADVIVNIQGDEPLVTGAMLDQLVACFENDPEQKIEMATLARRMNLEDLHSPQTAKIVLNRFGEALYFSRFPLPYSRRDAKQFPELNGSLKHIGIYAYRKDFLRQFCEQTPVAMEEAEALEQLRALYLGAKIRVAMVEDNSWGVDTIEDLQRVESLLMKKGN